MDIARGDHTSPSWHGAHSLAAEAIAAMRSGQIDATIDYDDGTSLALRVRFDFGGARPMPRIHCQAIARNASGVTHAGESLLCGARAWTRATDGRWLLEAPGDAVLPGRDIARTLRTLLPDVAAITDPVLARTADAVALRWRDESLNAEMRLELEPNSGVPLRYRRETRSTGVVLAATFSEWNRPVVIIPPDEPELDRGNE